MVGYNSRELAAPQTKRKRTGQKSGKQSQPRSDGGWTSQKPKGKRTGGTRAKQEEVRKRGELTTRAGRRGCKRPIGARESVVSATFSRGASGG